MTKTKVLIFSFVFLILILVVILLISGGKPIVSPTPSATPSPTAIPTPQTFLDGPRPGGNYQTITEVDKQQLDQDSKVGQLIKNLPYTGTNFNLAYDINTNSFTITINQDNKDQGTKEFSQFLVQNNILQQSWLYNLKIVYK